MPSSSLCVMLVYPVLPWLMLYIRLSTGSFLSSLISTVPGYMHSSSSLSSFHPHLLPSPFLYTNDRNLKYTHCKPFTDDLIPSLHSPSRSSFSPLISFPSPSQPSPLYDLLHSQSSLSLFFFHLYYNSPHSSLSFIIKLLSIYLSSNTIINLLSLLSPF